MKIYLDCVWICRLKYWIFLKFQKCECPRAGIVRELPYVSDTLFSCWTLKL